MEPPSKQLCSSSTTANVAATEHENTSSLSMSNPPNNLIYHIFMTNQNLHSETDLSRLKAVNSFWRFDLDGVSNPEETHIEVPNLDNNVDSPKLFLRQSCFYLLSPPNPADGVPWLVRMIKLGPNKWQLMNPVIDELTPEYFIADPPITAKIDLLVFPALELAKSFCLVDNVDYITRPISKKVVGGRVRYRNTSDEKFTALVQLAEDERSDEVLLWKSGDQQWVRIRVGPTFEQQEEDLQGRFRILDMAFHNEKFYIFYSTSIKEWEIGVINPDNNSCSILCYPLQFIGNNPEDEFAIMQYIYNIKLTSTNDGLYFFYEEWMFEAGGESTITMSAFLIKGNEQGEEQKSYWECERLSNLGNQTFFLGFGDNVSFALQSSAEKLPQWEPGTICWYDFSVMLDLDGHGVEESGAKFPMPEGVESLRSLNYPYYHLYFKMAVIGEEKRGRVSTFRAMARENQEMYTRLFFPPPNWVHWYCPTLNDVEVRLDGLQFHELDDPNDDD